MGSRAREQYKRPVDEHFPERLEMPGFRKALPLRYGHNPRGPAAFYVEDGASGSNMSSFKVPQAGKGLGYINVGDMDLGQRVVREIQLLKPEAVPYCIVKHEIPSGVALSADVNSAFEKAWGCDSLSSFGGVHVTHGTVDKSLAERLIDREFFVEVIYAPNFTAEALEILRSREALRVVQMPKPDQSPIDNGLEYKRVAGGMLVESRTPSRILFPEDLECIAGKPTSEDYEAALLMWQVARWTRSNAVVIGTADRTHGIGAGQQSRIDAAYMAIRKANGRDNTNLAYGSQGAVLASDGFFVQNDVVKLAADNGVRGVVAPLGSVNDEVIIAEADRRGLFFLATRRKGEQDSERGFLHR
ncbi:MAG: hypothetical protein AABX59_00415 [Nanoarchaeota archaeon]